MKTIKLENIELIFRETFPDADEIEFNKDLKINDFKAWDSLGNFNFLLAIEEFHKIRFSIDEMSEIKSIAQLIEILEKK